MPRIVHFELPVGDAARAVAFYRDVLGWDLADWGGSGYWMARTGSPEEPGIDGALLRRTASHETPVLVAAVDDVGRYLSAAVDAGGVVVSHRQPVPGVGWSGYFRDPEGNVVGLFQPDDSAGRAPGGNDPG